jgi:rubrerythrin
MIDIPRRRHLKLNMPVGKSATAKAGKMHLNVHRKAEAGDDAWPEFRVPPSQAQPKAVFTTCHYCGYDPGVIPADAACPKCGGHSWERNAISVKLLPHAKAVR